MQQLNKDIYKIALPSILANITVPLVGMVDIAVAGHLGSGLGGAAVPIGGITIGSMMFDMLYWSFGFLRVGVGGLAAQAYGRGDRPDQAGTLFKGVSLAMLIALTVIALQWPFSKMVFLFVKTSPEVVRLSLEYFFIRIWAAPATLSLMSFKGWFIGMQDGVNAMFCDLIVNVMNVVGSVVLAMGWPALGIPAMGFAGIAVGTVIAQYTGLVFATLVVFIKYRGVIRQGSYTLGGSGLKQFASLNIDLFIRSLCILAIYVGVTVISARYGDLLLATSSIMMNLLLFFSYFTDGFAFAGEALVGKFIGMRDLPMMKTAARKVFVWSMSIGGFFILVYILGGGPILRLMTSDNAVIEACRQFFIWLIPMPIIGCAAFTFDGIYTGATASKALRDSALLSVVAFFVTWFALIPFSHDGVTAIHILMAAYFAHLAIRTVYQWIKYHRSVEVEPFENL